MLALSSSLTVPTLKPMLASWVCRAVTPTDPVARPCQLARPRLIADPRMDWPIREFNRVDRDVSMVTRDEPMVKPARGWMLLTALRDTFWGVWETKGKSWWCSVDAVTRTAVAEARLAGSDVNGPSLVGPHSTRRVCSPSVYGKPLRTALAWAAAVGLAGRARMASRATMSATSCTRRASWARVPMSMAKLDMMTAITIPSDPRMRMAPCSSRLRTRRARIGRPARRAASATRNGPAGNSLFSPFQVHNRRFRQAKTPA